VGGWGGGPPAGGRPDSWSEDEDLDEREGEAGLGGVENGGGVVVPLDVYKLYMAAESEKVELRKQVPAH